MPIESLRVPAWCPTCGSLMKGRSTTTYYSFGVCVHCFIEWVEGREDKWKAGWRPSAEAIQRFREKLAESSD